MFGMSNDSVLLLAAVVAISPLVLVGLYGRLDKHPVSWLLLGSAVIGGSLPAIQRVAGAWSFALGANLIVSAALVLIVFALTVILARAAMRLAPIVGIYALALLFIGFAVEGVEPVQPTISISGGWFGGHILLATASYGALSLAAIAACAVLILERGLKSKSAAWAGRAFPPLVETDAIQTGLLRASAVFMFFALLSGLANEYLSTGHLFMVTHKILLSVLSFGVLCLLLYFHHRTGLRGRRAARWVLAGFVLLTLAYPGVKFIREFLLA